MWVLISNEYPQYMYLCRNKKISIHVLFCYKKGPYLELWYSLGSHQNSNTLSQEAKAFSKGQQRLIRV